MAVTKANIERAEHLYQEHYKGRGIPSRQAGMLKEVMAKALQKGEKPRAAAKAWLAEKGIVLGDAPEKAAEPAKATEGKKEEKAEKKKEEAPAIKLEKSKLVDRDVLIASAREVEAAGLSLGGKVESMTDDELRLSIHVALDSLATSSNAKALSKLPGEATMKVLEAFGCVGIYVDLRNAECVACPDQADCVRGFLGNASDGFRRAFSRPELAEVRKLLEEIVVTLKGPKAIEVKKEAPPAEPKKVEETFASAKAPANGVSESKKAKEKPAEKVEAYDPKKEILVFDEKNPQTPGTLTYAFVNAVLTQVPSNMAEFDPIWRRYKGEGLQHKTMKESLDWLWKQQIACCPDDLSKAERESIGIDDE